MGWDGGGWSDGRHDCGVSSDDRLSSDFVVVPEQLCSGDGVVIMVPSNSAAVMVCGDGA